MSFPQSNPLIEQQIHQAQAKFQELLKADVEFDELKRARLKIKELQAKFNNEQASQKNANFTPAHIKQQSTNIIV